MEVFYTHPRERHDQSSEQTDQRDDLSPLVLLFLFRRTLQLIVHS